VLCVASTSIASLLLLGRRTSHSAFKIPINTNEHSTCNVSKTGKTADFLRSVGLIIWDEVLMQHKFCFEAVDQLLLDLHLNEKDILFRGVLVVLRGDFAQILLVVLRGKQADTVAACLQRSYIWPRLKRIHLRTNMRVWNGVHDAEFVDWLQRLSYDKALCGYI
jgi:hypothetical protein